MSADLRCNACNETATHVATFRANPKLTTLTCRAGFVTLDADLWAVRKLTRRDFGLDPLPRGRKVVTA